MDLNRGSEESQCLKCRKVSLGDGLVEPPANSIELIKKGLIVARSVAKADEDVLHVRVFNPTEKQMIIQAGTVIASLSRLEEVSMEMCKLAEPNETNTNKDIPEHLKDLFVRSTDEVPAQCHNLIKELLVENADVFSIGPSDLGQTSFVQHSIDTGTAIPIRQAQRRHPMTQRKEIDEQVKNLLAQGLIEPVTSPWASNIVLVKKKDGSHRLCVVYRQLNAETIKDAFPRTCGFSKRSSNGTGQIGSCSEVARTNHGWRS
nr:uncharacterized protein LOC129277281 [Lytechinus pictus]